MEKQGKKRSVLSLQLLQQKTPACFSDSNAMTYYCAHMLHHFQGKLFFCGNMLYMAILLLCVVSVIIEGKNRISERDYHPCSGFEFKSGAET